MSDPTQPFDINRPVSVAGMGANVALAPPRPTSEPPRHRKAPVGGTQPAPLLHKSAAEIQRAGSRASLLWEQAVEEGHPFVLKKTAKEKATGKFIDFDIRIRRPSMAFVLGTGRLPADVKARVNELIRDARDRGVDPVAAMQEGGVEEIELIYALARATLVCASVDPIFYEPHPHDRTCRLDGTPASPGAEAPVSLVDYEDLLAIFTFCNQLEAEDAAEVAEFPQGSTGDLDVGPEGEAVRAETI